MSPAWGQELHPATMQDSGRRKSKGSTDEGYGHAFVSRSLVRESSVHGQVRMSTSQSSLANRPHGQGERRSINDSTVDAQLHKHAAVSVKSMSSTENSRRDSAISASSQHRRRPKTSRSMSKRSLQLDGSDDLTKTVSHSSRHRPRGQRFASSGSFHAPHANIEEALALHARSCELFAQTSRPTTSHNQVPSPYGPYTHPGLYRSLSSADALPISQYASEYATPFCTNAESSGFEIADEDNQFYTSSFPSTVLHWTSDETRIKEYAAIDRSNTGVRGLLKKLLPKCVMKSQTKFYDEKDGSDAGSVRRIRLDIPSEKNGEETRRSKLPHHFGI